MARKVVYERSGEPAQVVRVVESDEPRAPERGQVRQQLVRVASHVSLVRPLTRRPG